MSVIARRAGESIALGRDGSIKVRLIKVANGHATLVVEAKSCIGIKYSNQAAANDGERVMSDRSKSPLFAGNVR